jgi:hypothetical protein
MPALVNPARVARSAARSSQFDSPAAIATAPPPNFAATASAPSSQRIERAGG